MMQQINLQVTAPNEKVVGLEMTVEVKLPDGRPVKVKLKPEVRPNETIVVPVSVPDNTKSNNAYVYSNDANVSILNDGDDMLESGMMNMQQDTAPFSKEILFNEIPWILKRYIKWFGLLDQNTVYSKSMRYFGFFTSITYLILLLTYWETIDDEGTLGCRIDIDQNCQLKFMPKFWRGRFDIIWLQLSMIFSLYYMYGMFDDGGSYFHQLWSKLSPKEIKSVKRFARIFNAIYLFLLNFTFLFAAFPAMLQAMTNYWNAPTPYLVYRFM